MHDGVFAGPCYHCKCDMWLPRSLYEAAQHSEKITFYCAYGHGQCFAKGESELTLIRRENARLFQQMAQKDDALRDAELRLDKSFKEYRTLKASAVKARKRSVAGVCPCCHRTFRQMALHMANKHPTFKAEEVA